MGQKVIIRFSGLSSASRDHLTTFCRPLDLCSAIVHYIPNNYRLLSACADGIGYISNFCSMIKLLQL